MWSAEAVAEDRVMYPADDIFGMSNPPSPPPPEYNAMINKMAGVGYKLSAPDDVITNPHSHSFSKPALFPNGSAWPLPSLAMDVSTSMDLTDTDMDSTSMDSPPLGMGSKFVDRVKTNYIPSSSEMAEIKNYVMSVNQKVSAYDICIAELEAALKTIKYKRDKLHETASIHEALISPLRRLPPEILQLIFVWCLSPKRNAVMHASEAPVLLGRICSEWRRISIATPELWATLHIVPPNVNLSNPEATMQRFQHKRDLVAMWLARSGACPLSISLVWFAGDSEEEIKLCGMLLDVLVPLSRRWKVMDFQVPLKMFKPFIGLTVDDAPFLEGMSLMDNRTPHDSDAGDRWPESLTFAEGATRLRNFTLTFFSGGIRLPTIPWHQLTVLYLESNIAFFFRDAREMLTTLGECTSLTSCTLKFALSHTASLPAYDRVNLPITLPNLQILCVDGDQHLHNTFHMSNTLSNICAPRLRQLEILGRSGRPEGSVAPEPLAAIRTLLQKSKCPLEKLNIESMTMVPDEFIACLRLVPTLTELIVHNWSVRVMVGLSPTGDEPADANEVAENQILKALTIPTTQVGEVPLPALYCTLPVPVKLVQNNNGGRQLPSVVEPIELPGFNTITTMSQLFSPTSVPTHFSSDLILCPNLERFDFTLCDASQSLLCDFVASRWSNLPEGVVQIKTVKCEFTAFEDFSVKEQLQKFRTEGLDAFITYQVPIHDDMNPSPWTGLEGPS